MKNFVAELSELIKEYPQYKLEFGYKYWKTNFLRFFQSMTNYNITKEVKKLSCTIYKGKRSFSFGMVNPNINELRKKILYAEKFIDNLPEDPDFVDIEDDKEIARQGTIINNTEKINLKDKINILSELSNAVQPYDFKIYGTFITNYTRSFIINSNGVNKEYITSPVMLDVKAVSDKNQVTVIETYGGEDFAKFNLNNFKSRLLDKTKLANLPIIDMEPGKYEVIFGPAAISEFIQYLLYGSSAQALDMGNSCFQDKINERIFPENISISDSPHNDRMIRFYYDQNGHTLKKLDIIKNGIYKNFMVDNYYGNKLKLKKNGNMGTNIVLEPGDKSLDEMIKSVKNGLYISKLHYMNFINMKETTVTGLTRDGTFLIKNGEITNVTNNLRYTISLMGLLKNITAIENKNYVLPFSTNYGEFFILSSLMPSVMVSDFNVTSSTKTI